MEKIELNEKLVANLRTNVFIKEKNNAKTKRYSRVEMIDIIKKLIQSEVDRYDN